MSIFGPTVVGELGILSSAQNQDFSGFWGGVNFVWTGGIIDGFRYRKDGTVADVAPMMGVAPTLRLGNIGKYAQLAKLTKGFKGTIQAYHLAEARHLRSLALSSKNGPSAILTRADHAVLTRSLQQLLPYGRTYTKSQSITAYKEAYKNNPEWIRAVIKYLK